MKNSVNTAEIEETHKKLRDILISYGCEEYGDVILDDICLLFNYPTTTEPLTDVKFLIEKPEGELNCEVFAFFPNENYFRATNVKRKEVSKDDWQNMKTCYSHIGQHSACHSDYANECTEATKEQFADLAQELKSIGYNLNILNK